MEQNSGQWFLAVICCTPFLAGLASGAGLMFRVFKMGLWGLLPFGGTFKQWWQEKQG
jgi:hypothetical protein